MSTKAIRQFHQQILKKATESVANDTLSDRKIHSMIVAIPKSQLPMFSEKMKAFLHQFWEEMRDTEMDELYALSLHLTPVRNGRG